MDALVVGVGEYFEFVGLPFDESCCHAGIMRCLGVKLNQSHHVGDVGRKSNRGVGRDKLAIHSLSLLKLGASHCQSTKLITLTFTTA